MAHQIRILIADDHSILRLGLATFLGNYDDMLMVGEAVNGQQAVDLCESLHPDVILMDLTMPVLDGMAATAIIHETSPQTRVIVLTSAFSDETREEALHAGARDYLHKTISVDVLADAIRKAAS